MPNKRISQLDPLNTPSLTGVTAFSENDTTYKVTLQALKDSIIETGSIQTTGTTLYSANPLAGLDLNTNESIFFGTFAGSGASYANNSIFLGYGSGRNAPNAYNSVYLGEYPGAFSSGYTDNNIFLGYRPGYVTHNAGYSIFLGSEAGAYYNNTELYGGSDDIFIGQYAGYYADKMGGRNVGIGQYALSFAKSGENNVGIGQNAGYYARPSSNNVFIGTNSGNLASGSVSTIGIGHHAAEYLYYADNSVVLGVYAGEGAERATSSVLIGFHAGQDCRDIGNSNFIGYYAGQQQRSASFCNFIGHRAGYNRTADKDAGLGLGRNNIIIGTNLTLPSSRKDSINIGGIIFGTGSYFDVDILSSGSAGGKIGINKVVPEHHFDVSGSIAGNAHLILSKVSSSFDYVDDTAASAGGVPLGGLYRSGSLIRIRLA